MNTCVDSIQSPARAVPVAALYLSGMLQGLTLVSFPASSVVLKQMHDFSDAQYGAIFLPQVVAAVIGAFTGARFSERFGLKVLLWIALLINALSQGLLAAMLFLSHSLAFPAVLLGTACLGFGFGLSGAPLNGLPPLLFPTRRDTSIVALHTFLGLGLALGPVVANPFILAGHWVWFPISLAGLALSLVVLTSLSRFPGSRRSKSVSDYCGSMSLPEMNMLSDTGALEYEPLRQSGFWMFAVITVFYAFAEGTFANWAVIYLQDVKNLPQTVAAGALSVFWAAMVAGRLLTSVLVLRFAPSRIWMTLPVLMIAAFLLLPHADTAFLGIGLFALAGLACSAFFPLCISIASKYYPADVPRVSSMLIAALMVGVGTGSWLVGLLRERVAMEDLYRLSVFYPLAAFVLAYLVLRRAKR
ncbi:MAG: MFS transporter [Gammaproteobacteria bacterium]